MKRAHLLLLAVVFEGGMAVLGCLLGWLIGSPPWLNVHWGTDQLYLAALATIPMLLAFFIVYRYPIGPLRSIRELSLDFIAPLFGKCTVLDLAIISMLAGVGEEFFFRGFLMAALSRWLGDLAGIALSSLVFGLLHPINITYVVLATLAGAYFACFTWLTGNLFVAIATHALYDFVALVVLAQHARNLILVPPEADGDRRDSSAPEEESP